MNRLELRKRTFAAAAAWLIFEVTVIETAVSNKEIFEWLSRTGWVSAVAVLLASFGLTLAVTMLAEWTARVAASPEPRPDLDAYIDQMIAANGTHLHRD